MSDGNSQTEIQQRQEPCSNQQRPTSRLVDTTQQSVDDEALSKIRETDVKQVIEMTENKQQQMATAKQSK